MSRKTRRLGSIRVLPHRCANENGPLSPTATPRSSGTRQTRSVSFARSARSGNQYLCAIERNHNGKYNVRVRTVFGKDGWVLPVYFLASSFNAAMKKLEESLQLLQKSEHRLRFWAVERSDDPNMAGDLLGESGLWLDRRPELSRKVAGIRVPPDRQIPASMLASLRRGLADAVTEGRLPTALAGD